MTCDCRTELVQAMAEKGVEVNASPWRPGMTAAPYDDFNMSCPHGVRWHLEPTTDQIAAWVRDGVA